jgi:hypothetical protein
MYCTIEATWKGTAKWSQRRRVWIRKWFHDRPFNLLPCLCNLARILVQRSSGLIEIETDVHTISRRRFLEKTIYSCLLTRPKHSFLLVETLLFSLKSCFCRQKKYWFNHYLSWWLFSCLKPFFGWLKVVQLPGFGCWNHSFKRLSPL